MGLLVFLCSIGDAGTGVRSTKTYRSESVPPEGKPMTRDGEHGRQVHGILNSSFLRWSVKLYFKDSPHLATAQKCLRQAPAAPSFSGSKMAPILCTILRQFRRLSS